MFISCYIPLICSFSQRFDTRERRDRIDRRTDQWKLQLDALIEAYLSYHLHAGEDQQVSESLDGETTGELDIEVVDIFCAFQSYFFLCE